MTFYMFTWNYILWFFFFKTKVKKSKIYIIKDDLLISYYSVVFDQERHLIFSIPYLGQVLSSPDSQPLVDETPDPLVRWDSYENFNNSEVFEGVITKTTRSQPQSPQRETTIQGLSLSCLTLILRVKEIRK